MTTEDNYHIELEKLNYLFDNLLSGLLAILTLAIIVLLTFYDLIDNNTLNIWFILTFIVLLLRYSLLYSYKKSDITILNLKKYYWLFFLLTSFSAFLWGCSVIFIIDVNIEYKMIILLLVGGLVAGSAISLASKIEIFYLYVVLSLAPFSYIFFIGDTDAYHVLSIAIAIYIFVLFILSKKVSFNIAKNIKLAYQNQTLILQLKDKVEEANVANKAKSEFLSVMSHEIRTPLNAIMGFVQILKRSETDSKKLKYLDTIANSSKILTNVINDILDISKIESGKFSLEMREFKPENEFNSLYLLFKQDALKSGITLTNSISKELPTLLKSDILRIKQIIANLLSNAIKFTSEGKNVELIIEFNKSNSSLYVEVKDEGIGISKENIPKIIESFTQADSSTAREYGGTGLGLAIVIKLLKLLDSKLKIKSELHEGSNFSFELKVEVVEPENTQEIDSKTILFPNKRVLVAEDNQTNQLLIKVLLQDLKIDVVIVNNGLEAENIFKKESFDLVLMDINMPLKNGINAMLSIKEFQNETNIKTPLIALTANAVSGDRKKYLKNGFDEYLAKPIELDKLTTLLKEYLS